jgi:hypothetical protein
MDIDGDSDIEDDDEMGAPAMMRLSFSSLVEALDRREPLDVIRPTIASHPEVAAMVDRDGSHLLHNAMRYEASRRRGPARLRASSRCRPEAELHGLRPPVLFGTTHSRRVRPWTFCSKCIRPRHGPPIATMPVEAHPEAVTHANAKRRAASRSTTRPTPSVEGSTVGR